MWLREVVSVLQRRAWLDAKMADCYVETKTLSFRADQCLGFHADIDFSSIY